MARGRHRTGSPSNKFVKLTLHLMKSQACLSLSGYSFKLLAFMMLKYNGSNNGEIPFSVREASKLLNCADNTSQNTFRELERKGFILVVKKGTFNRKNRHATEWALTEYSIGDKAPTKNYRQWVRSEEQSTASPVDTDSIKP